jgi:hypothetical protein
MLDTPGWRRGKRVVDQFFMIAIGFKTSLDSWSAALLFLHFLVPTPAETPLPEYDVAALVKLPGAVRPHQM